MKNYKQSILKRLLLIIPFLMIQLSIFAITAPPTTGGTTTIPIGSGCMGGTGGNCSPISSVIPENPGVIKLSHGDEACTAKELNTGLSCTEGSIDTATNSATPPKPSCWPTAANKDVWWFFYATSQDMTISTDAILFNLANQKDQPGFGLYDSRLALYSSADGTCNTLSQMKCDDNSGINGTNVPLQNYGVPKQAIIEVTGLVPGEKYYVRLDGGSGATGGNFCISAFNTYTPGSTPCEPQNIHPNNLACGDAKRGNTAVNWTSTNNVATSTNGIQPNAYRPLGELTGIQWNCSPGLDMGQYGVWTRWEDDYSPDPATTYTLTNSSGGTRMYTLFTARTCLNMECLDSYTLANNASQTITGLTKGNKYYILTTLLPGDMTQTFTTTLCLRNGSAPFHDPTEKNEGGVPFAGGTVNTDLAANSYGVTLQQPYYTTTYAAAANGCTTPTGCGNALGQPCNVGNNVFFHYEVPADFPCAPARLYFQMWNKNCTGGPLNGGTDMPVATCAAADDQCYDFGNVHNDLPNNTGNNNEPTDGHYDWATNIGWEPNSFSGLYTGVFTGHQNEVCDFNFQINNSPSLNGIEGQGDTVCLGDVARICGKYATGYEWISSDLGARTVEGDLIQGNTNACMNISPTVTTNYTVVATSGADGADIARITVVRYPIVRTDTATICPGQSSATLHAYGAEEYLWTPLTNLTNVNDSTKTANPAASTNYTVIGTVGRERIKPNGFPGCKDTSIARVNVSPLPTATISGAVTVCLNDPEPAIRFTGGSSAPPYTFIYRINGGATQTVTTTPTSNTVTVNAPTGSGAVLTYSLVSVNNGPNTCSQNQTGGATVTVNALGATLAGTTTVCQKRCRASCYSYRYWRSSTLHVYV